ncbi:hypothetical protein Tsubulata_013602 [Turnera subulata]|uniref:Glycosyltransferase family 92 protein n=1 Tax=Turnera subulata TaxID=218843 RepID=A0A9Q0FS39_9ROSI|nr:hypothetical protein Tsubulata_013602 [Turnera subulata]
MDSSEQRRKRKRFNKLHAGLFRLRSLTMLLPFLIVLFIVTSHWSALRERSFHPVLKVPNLSFLPSGLQALGSYDAGSSALVVEDRILFPDHLLVIVSSRLHPSESLECVYYSHPAAGGELQQVVLKPAISVDEFNGGKSIVRCLLPPVDYSATVNLRRSGDGVVDGEWLLMNNHTRAVATWDRLVYEAILDWNSTVVLFAKGLNLRPHVESDKSHFRCHFGLSNFDKDEGFVFTTEATSAAQEVIRCLLPRSIWNNPEKAQGIRVTVSHFDGTQGGVDALPLPSVAKVYSTNSYQQRREKYELCACTMMWNQASFLREWIMYHGWLGVQRWFIYDNNSDDGLKEVVDELNAENYNVSRHAWPWIKTQEAGFSHCALRARHECKWVGFFDVDEFFYFPQHQGQAIAGPNSLRALVANYTDSPTYAEIRTTCHSFGPSGLTTAPSQGVTAGYTCRLHAPERHKSIVRPDLLHTSLLNVVHHFRLREGYRYLNVPESTALVNHYKYQVWDTFKAKFFRRVSTYVANWQDDQNKGSKDRAPGLGTVAIEPQDWRLRFCEVWDTGLKDFVLANFAETATGYLPWERSALL